MRRPPVPWIRLRERGDDAGAAMLTVLLLMLIVGALSTLVVGAVVSEVKPTKQDQNSTSTVYAAEAGLQAGLNQLKSAVTVGTGIAAGTVTGDKTKLPCSLTGSVGTADEQVGYEDTFAYYSIDPTGKTAVQLAPYTLACLTPGGVSSTPSFALVTAVGRDRGVAGAADDAGRRTLQVQYQFQLTNAQLIGGLIRVGGSCLTTANPPVAGSAVATTSGAACQTGNVLQTWFADKDYSIKLAVSKNAKDASGASTALCLTQPASGSGGPITLQVCQPGPAADNGTARAAWNQLWSRDGNGIFSGQNSTNTNFANCWQVVSGALVSTASGSCTTGITPDASVGAGAAGYDTHQIVSFFEFGRCMDVTGGVISQTFMIVFPCKQDPSVSGSNLYWNHKWFYTEPAPQGTVNTTGLEQQISVYVNNTSKYCLTAPAAGVSPAYVTFVGCSATSDAQKFIRYNTTSDYTTSYRFVTRDGRCLSLGPQWNGWSTIVAVTCTGGNEQKWNAPANPVKATTSGTRELFGTGS